MTLATVSDAAIDLVRELAWGQLLVEPALREQAGFLKLVLVDQAGID